METKAERCVCVILPREGSSFSESERRAGHWQKTRETTLSIWWSRGISHSYCSTAIICHFSLRANVSNCLLEIPIWISQIAQNLIYPKLNSIFSSLSPTTNPAQRLNVIYDSFPFLQSHNTV